MAHTFHRAASPAFGAHPVGAALSRFTAWNDARRTRKILSQLTAYELEDIGLSRDEIDNIGR